MIAEVSSVANGGSRLAPSRPRRWRLTALSHGSPQTDMLRWSRRLGLGVRLCSVVAEDSMERYAQLAHDGDEGEAGGLACVAQLDDQRARADVALVATAGLHGDQQRPQRCQSVDQFGQTFRMHPGYRPGPMGQPSNPDQATNR